jgi:hypothetical protein
MKQVPGTDEAAAAARLLVVAAPSKSRAGGAHRSDKSSAENSLIPLSITPITIMMAGGYADEAANRGGGCVEAYRQKCDPIREILARLQTKTVGQAKSAKAFPPCSALDQVPPGEIRVQDSKLVS